MNKTIALVFLCLLANGSAATLTLSPSKDNSLFQFETNTASGIGKLFIGRVGDQAAGGLRRALMAFDVSGISAGSTIESVTLSFQVTQVRVSDAKPATIHRVLADWGEGTSNATRGQGAAATANDATWEQRFFNSSPATPWSTPGGDFVDQASAATTIMLASRYAFSGDGLVADVQAWVNGGSPNHGWALLGDEMREGSALHIASSEDGNSSFRPVLTIRFSESDGVPNGYYDSAEGLTGGALREALHDIIDNHTVIPYSAPSNITDTSDALRVIDEDPANSSNLILIYSRRSESKSNFASGSGWNREHLWPQSLGVSQEPARSDLHGLRPADENVNSERGNKHLDRSSAADGFVRNPGHSEAPLTRADDNSWEPPDAYKGDIARSLLYLDLRYSGDAPFEPDLILTDRLENISQSNTLMGRLSTLLRWHFEDPVSAEERTRNDRVFTFQNNRNPFVDRPDYVWQVYLNVVRARLVNGRVQVRWPSRYDFVQMAVGSRVSNIAPIASSAPPIENGEHVFAVDPLAEQNFFLPGID